ncbi:fimbrial protein [Enterobacter kobei]|uniref:fimbrial protein n=1 Tax=Enterobacter kobei TaxID=208224 RepID=UPI003BEF247F
MTNLTEITTQLRRNMDMLKGILFLILFLAAMSICGRVQAQVTCEPRQKEFTDTISLSGSYYVGNDMPVGSIIGQVNFKNKTPVGIQCVNQTENRVTIYTPFRLSVASEPYGPPVVLDGKPVYPTNIHGVGVQFMAGSIAFAQSYDVIRSWSTSFSPDASSSASGTFYEFSLALIKTGSIETGGELNGSAIPKLQLSLPGDIRNEENNVHGFPMPAQDIIFTGSIKYITQTCKTPNLNVILGDYDIKEFETTDSTPWIDSSIRLENCPTFTGYYNNQNGQNVSGSGTPTGSILNNNVLTVSIQPTAGFMDEASGLIKLTDSPNTAQGVGIQLGYTPNINASPTSPSIIWRGERWNITPPVDGRGSFLISLAARYYKHQSVITPGSANGKVIFTIEYK